MKSFFLRSCIVVSWVAFIFLILFWPKIHFFPDHSRSLHILAWGDILDPKVIADFEQETGIRVHFNYYTSNEELLVKLKATKGAGYDLIIPSDYAMPTLIQENLLQPIDKTALPFWQELCPHLLNHAYDPNNQYSIPFAWEIFLFGAHKDSFSSVTPSWKLLFDPKVINYRVAMTNDPIEAVLFASFYLFGPDKTSLSPAEVEQVKELLIQQKQWVEAYASFRGDYFLATGSCKLAIASSSYFWRTLQLFPSLTLLVPEEGTFLTIENLALPRLSQKQPWTYELIRYLFRQESIASHFTTFGFFPATLHSKEEKLPLSPEARNLLLSLETEQDKFHFIYEILSRQQTNELWVEVKLK
ncbi:MAG: extracellular solute-binding protein [Chlamydiae bacterium]|nr:extracellular solute-binding protein [Chlamydiota bacterium]